MTVRPTRIALLRRERHPLVALTVLAVLVRLTLGVLAGALSPQAAAAAGLTSLCQPSGLSQSLPGSHDPATCQCGPLCAHGCAAAPAPAASLLAEGPALVATGIVLAIPRSPTVLPRKVASRAIRAPPLSLNTETT